MIKGDNSVVLCYEILKKIKVTFQGVNRNNVLYDLEYGSR